MSDTLSRVEDILENIVGEGSHTLEPPLSEIEEILLAILNDTEVNIQTRDRVNKILLAIKNDTEYNDPPLSRIEEILLAILAGEKYTPRPGEPLSRVEELLIEWANKEDPTYIKTVSGLIVTVLDAVAEPAISLKMNIEPKQDGTPFSVDSNEPYLSKTAATTGNKRYLDKIIGGTVAWNQLEPLDASKYTKTNIALSLSNGEYTFTPTTSTSVPKYAGMELTVGHVYFISGKIGSSSNTTRSRAGIINTTGTNIISINGQGEYRSGAFIHKLATNEFFALRVNNATTPSESGYAKDLQITDLTLMFGSAIADYIYSLEQATAGAGVAWLKDYGFIDDNYRAYNAGELISTRPSGIKFGRTTETFGSPVELRGMYRLSATTTKLYCTGDELAPDGTKTTKWSAYDLGTRTWNATSTYFYCDISAKKNGVTNLICSRYVTSSGSEDKTIKGFSTSSRIAIYDSSYSLSDIEEFKTAMSGVYVLVEMERPTTSSSQFYHNPVDIKNGDTEAFIDTRSIPLPVGNNTTYKNIVAITGWTGAEVNINSNTQTASFGRTVYGGTVDLVSGELIITDGYIASYNGESLPGVWISDRDVYSEGTSPTIGAQVVYELATPQTYTLTPQQIEMLEGTNTIWVDLINEDTTTESVEISLTYKGTNPAMMMSALRAQNNVLKKQGLQPIKLTTLKK